MGIRIDQAGSPGLDPAAGTTSGVSTARRVASSQPATSQTVSSPSVDPQLFSEAAAQVQTSMPAQEMDVTEMKGALEGVNEYMREMGSSLSFVYDEASGRSAVQVLDERGEVIRQIPPQELLDVYAKIRDIVGILLDESG